MRNGSKLADTMYIKRESLESEDVRFFSVSLSACIAKQVMTFKQLQLLSCIDSPDTNFEHLVLFPTIPLLLPISPTPDLACYTRTSPTTTVPYRQSAYIPRQGVSSVVKVYARVWPRRKV